MAFYVISTIITKQGFYIKVDIYKLPDEIFNHSSYEATTYYTLSLFMAIGNWMSFGIMDNFKMSFLYSKPFTITWVSVFIFTII